MTETTQELSGLAAWVEAAVGEYERPLTQYAARIVGDSDQARDVVQDTFMKLWRVDRASVDGHLGQWLFRVCRNRALDIRRKDKRMLKLRENPPASHNRHVDAHGSTESSANVISALAVLPERQQEVIRLKFQAGLSYQEIANVMDITVNHVGVLIHNAIKSLRDKMKSENPSGASTEVTS